jgi:hypothetical protein
MSTTFVARTSNFPDQPDLEEKWFIGTQRFDGLMFNPQGGGAGDMPIEMFIDHIDGVAQWYTENDDTEAAQEALAYWYICMGAYNLGATEVVWG